MRTSLIYFALGTSLLACGDDSPGTPDARPIDARDIDAFVPQDGPTFKGYDADEGGEIRLEYLIFPSGNRATRTTAFFYKNSGTTKFFEYINLNGCNDMTSLPQTKWPMATNPMSERDYYDVGPYVVISGGPSPLSVPKRDLEEDDLFERRHPATDAWYLDVGNGTPAENNATTYLTEKTLYDVTLPGSTEFPGTFWEDAIYMPASFDLISPAQGTAAAPLLFDRDADQTFTWTTPTDTAPPGFNDEILSLVAFTGANGPAVICVEPNDGSVTVPAAMMNKALDAYPNASGTVARQTLTHAVRELVDENGPTGKRIDLLGVWCYAGSVYNESPL